MHTGIRGVPIVNVQELFPFFKWDCPLHRISSPLPGVRGGKTSRMLVGKRNPAWEGASTSPSHSVLCFSSSGERPEGRIPPVASVHILSSTIVSCVMGNSPFPWGHRGGDTGKATL